MGARALDGFKQTRRGAIGGRKRNRRFRHRGRIICDHRRAAAERERTVVKDNLSLADLDTAAAHERDRRLNYRAVVERAVRRSQVLKEIFIAFVAHFSMDSRGEGIGDAQVVARRAANRDAQAAEREVLGGPVRIFDDQFSHDLVRRASRPRSSRRRNNLRRMFADYDGSGNIVVQRAPTAANRHH